MQSIYSPINSLASCLFKDFRLITDLWLLSFLGIRKIVDTCMNPCLLGMASSMACFSSMLWTSVAMSSYSSKEYRNELGVVVMWMVRCIIATNTRKSFPSCWQKTVASPLGEGSVETHYLWQHVNDRYAVCYETSLRNTITYMYKQMSTKSLCYWFCLCFCNLCAWLFYFPLWELFRLYGWNLLCCPLY